MTWESFSINIAGNWGGYASIVGVVISIWTLVVARGAKRAAEGVRLESRRRNLAEELQDVHKKTEQVGLFLRDAKWEVIFLRGQEIGGACNVILKRWGAELDDSARDDILMAERQADLITKIAMRTRQSAPGTREFGLASAAQRKLLTLLSGQVGRSLKLAEGSGESDV